MSRLKSSMKKIAWNQFNLLSILVLLSLLFSRCEVCYGQDDGGEKADDTVPPLAEECNGIFLTYTFGSVEKELPKVKNVTAQAWAFRSDATILNAGSEELKAWKMFIGFQHREILVSADGAIPEEGGDFPVAVGNGTVLFGYPMSDLKTSIDTAGDYTQIQARVEMKGTLFGIKRGSTPMPKTIRLENDGFKCPAPSRRGPNMYVCCKKDPKAKTKPKQKTKFLPRQRGDLSLTYDVLQAYGGSYLAQVTIDNNNPLGRLDHWNLTWEWMRGEFINTMKGAYTHKRDPSECVYGQAGVYYRDLDFSQVHNCQKKPVISDLPPEKKNDEKVGKLPYCCRNGTVLPSMMDSEKSRSIFQLQVYKLPPDMNRTAITPPQKWEITGLINPFYKCGVPIRVEPTEFPDPSGLDSKTYAIASWQVVCNITKPKERKSRCCVSFSAFYNSSVIPCNTCACGCEDNLMGTCDEDAQAMLLPAEALLVPFANRTDKIKAWAKLKHKPVPKKLPCPDNCGVSINWHLNTDYSSGWTARITIFNWRDNAFEDWFAAIEMKKAYPGYENVYSFNGTKLQLNNTIFFQGLKDMNYLVGMTNGSKPDIEPRVPGKQQSVISFTKKQTPGIHLQRGDGFPTKVFFNGEECSLPKHFPTGNSVHQSGLFSFSATLLVAIATFLLLTDRISW